MIKLKEQIDYLNKSMGDTEIELEYSKDRDARIGHKITYISLFCENSKNSKKDK